MVLDNQLCCIANIIVLVQIADLFSTTSAGSGPSSQVKAAHLLVQALFISRLDSCNSLLAGLSAPTINLCSVSRPLQPASCSAYLLWSLLPALNWRIWYWPTRWYNRTAHAYLQALVWLHTPARALCSATSAGRLVAKSKQRLHIKSKLCFGTTMVEWAPCRYQVCKVAKQLLQETQDSLVQSSPPPLLLPNSPKNIPIKHFVRMYVLLKVCFAGLIFQWICLLVIIINI